MKFPLDILLIFIGCFILSMLGSAPRVDIDAKKKLTSEIPDPESLWMKPNTPEEQLIMSAGLEHLPGVIDAIEGRNADPNFKEGYALFLALRNKDDKMVKYLEEHGAKIIEEDKNAILEMDKNAKLIQLPPHILEKTQRTPKV